MDTTIYASFREAVAADGSFWYGVLADDAGIVRVGAIVVSRDDAGELWEPYTLDRHGRGPMAVVAQDGQSGARVVMTRRIQGITHGGAESPASCYMSLPAVPPQTLADMALESLTAVIHPL